jgi:hypothetical protein
MSSIGPPLLLFGSEALIIDAVSTPVGRIRSPKSYLRWRHPQPHTDAHDTKLRPSRAAANDRGLGYPLGGQGGLRLCRTRIPLSAWRGRDSADLHRGRTGNGARQHNSGPGTSHASCPGQERSKAAPVRARVISKEVNYRHGRHSVRAERARRQAMRPQACAFAVSASCPRACLTNGRVFLC